MREVLAITKALADENRVRILIALARTQLCVCQVAELLQLAPSTVSKHLSILRQGGLVETRKKGRWIFYFIPREPAASARQSIDWLRDALKSDSIILEDARRLKIVLKENPEEICRRQVGRSKSCSSATRAGARWPKDGRIDSEARSSRPGRPESKRTD